FTGYAGGQADGVRTLALPDGGFLIAWVGWDPVDPTLVTQPLLARHVDAQGKVGAELRLTDSSVSVPSLHARADGAIALAWADSGTAGDGNEAGIRFRLLAPDGTPCGDPVVANTTTQGEQFGPSVAATADGGFLVAWSDASGTAPDTDGTAVRAR